MAGKEKRESRAEQRETNLLMGNLNWFVMAGLLIAKKMAFRAASTTSLLYGMVYSR